MAELKDGLNSNGSMITDSLYNPDTGTGAGQIALDESQLDAVEAKRSEIVDYIRLRLADQIVDVELDAEHYNLAINQALIKYRQRAQNSQEESYAFLELKAETQEYILPKEVMLVRQVLRRGIGSVTGNTATQFEPFSAGYMNTYMLVAGRVGGLLSYELFVDYQKLVMRMFGGYMNFTFNPATKKLTVIRKLPEGTGPETVLLWCFNHKPDIVLFNDHMIFPWLQDYAYSFAKRIVGEAREKFSQIAGPQGGSSLNGSSLKTEAQAEMDALEQQLKDYVDGSQPLTWITG